ncbi:MAG: hypothetical protein O9341_18420, partial [Paucibacter sp.]|nr:hypothetical protein [Roseateles sp.]
MAVDAEAPGAPDGRGALDEVSLTQAEALIADEAFDAALQHTRALLERLRGREAEPAVAELARRIYQLRGDCLTRLDRFPELLADCAARMDLLSVDQASVQRAELMIKMSFAHANLAMPEQALRSAHVALQDALNLGQRLLAAQALERLAMAYLSMGDGVAAERFMFEALEHSDASSPPQERLRRVSNTVHLLCTLHDVYLDMGLPALGDSVLARAQGLPAKAEALLPTVPGRYLVCMWRANLARWQRRRGQLDEARRLFEDCLAQAQQQAWHAVSRPVQLELAMMAEQSADLATALQHVRDLFEPESLRVRDVVALPAYRMRERMCRLLGHGAEADEAAAKRRARQAARHQAVLEAAAHNHHHGQLILSTLAAAERQRVDAEIQRLRSQHAAG